MRHPFSPSCTATPIECLESRWFLAASLQYFADPTIAATNPVSTNASDPDAGTTYQTEMSISVNPTNPLNLAGFSHHITGSNRFAMVLVYSFDGGATWSTNRIDHEDDGRSAVARRFDPSLTFDREGRLHIVYGVREGDVTIFVSRSLDGGETFGQFVALDSGPAHDKWFITSGHDPVSGNSAVYIAYTGGGAGGVNIYVNGSRDGGLTFLPQPVSVTEAPAPQFPIFACPVVSQDGRLSVSWWNPQLNRILVDSDSDGLWGTAGAFGSDELVRVLNYGSIVRKQVPGATSIGISTAPILAADRSGHYPGRLYVTFIEWKDDSVPLEVRLDSDVFFGYIDIETPASAWQFTKIENSTGTDFLPWVDVDQATGSVHILYYTSDGDPTHKNVKMRLATSIDGGATWTKADATTLRSDESDDSPDDYLDYIGLDVHQGTGHGLFAFEPPGGSVTDLDAVYVNAAFVNANNTLTVSGTPGGDTITIQPSSVNSSYLEVSVNGVKEFVGRLATAGKLLINAGGGNDTVTIDAGVSINATIDGAAGADSITAGAGADVVYGGDANDTVFGGAGNDTLYGGNGHDYLDGGSGIDVMYGDAGNDYFYAVDGEADTLFGGAGTDIGEADTGLITDDVNDVLVDA